MAQVEVTWDMTGKMEGMCSISTSVTTNPNCQKNALIKGSICSKCYSQAMAKQYKDLDRKNQRNTDLLTTTLIPVDELPEVDPIKYPYCRLEAFGDLHNDIQLENYMNIVRKNKDSKWALYTKMYNLVYEYFKNHDVPENFTLIISSLMVDTPINVDRFLDLKKFKEGQLKVFTVYDKKYITTHPELKINCGARSCFKCHRCYDQRKELHVSEILKTDAQAATLLINMRNTSKVMDIMQRFNMETLKTKEDK